MGEIVDAKIVSKFPILRRDIWISLPMSRSISTIRKLQ